MAEEYPSMPYLEVSLVSPPARAWLPEEEMARIIEHIRLAFPYRSGEHFYRSSSDYLVIHMAKERPAKKQQSWLYQLQPTLHIYPDINSGCPSCNHPFDDAPLGICEKCHSFDPYKVSSIILAFQLQDYNKLLYLSGSVWGTVEDVYVRWIAVALAQLLFRGRISVEQIRHLHESGDHITPTEAFQRASSLGQDPVEQTLDLVKVTFRKQDYLLVQIAAERCRLDSATFIRRALWSSEAAFSVRCLRAATGRVHGWCDLASLLTNIDKPLKQMQQLQIEAEDVKSTAPTRLFNSAVWSLLTSTNALSQEHPLIATKLLEIVKNDALVSQPEPEQAVLAREKKRLQALDMIPAHALLPCTEQEVLALEQLLGYSLPLAYRAMLLWIGHGAGQLMQDLDCFYEQLFGFQQRARQMLSEHDCHLSLPEDAFVFFLSQDSCFSFIRASEGEDPPVYAYDSTWRRTPFQKVYRHFSDFLALEIEMFADARGAEKTIPHEVKLMLKTLVDFNTGAMFPAPKREAGE
jgi:hypothetical protein